MAEQLEHDVLIVGGGLAGLRAAIEACKTADTAIISKAHPLRSDSGAARGGINAALGRDDAWESHWRDTVAGGAYLGDQDACQVRDPGHRRRGPPLRAKHSRSDLDGRWHGAGLSRRRPAARYGVRHVPS